MIWNIIWLIFLIYSFIPLIKHRQIEIARLKLIRDIERKRNSRVITLIHRQESLSLLGLPISRYINIEDSEQILRAIRLTPDDMPIDIILHTPGGLVLAAEQIAHAIMKHPSKVTVFVPHYAMSGGTMIALAADEIVMDENAVLGPVDPQLGNYPAASILRVLAQKPVERIDDETLILADVAEKAMNQVRENVYTILSQNYEEEKARELARIFTEGRWTHDYPISAEELKNMGLTVSTDLPKEIYTLMELYPQTAQMRPSVHYVPIPYERKSSEKK
ncbi:SDH family Clp fold serine proteinase [Thermoanaerobacterium sp. DL9XJH110]|uniref:SDH family Clp fold serine proteinase n=1 Tax=Thermoanaerobacterium sp. DL9XJH110 TaxID=3386643 RepID=UPI003BB6D3C5